MEKIICENCGGSGVSDVVHIATSTLILGEVVQDPMTVYYACPVCGGKGEIDKQKEEKLT